MVRPDGARGLAPSVVVEGLVGQGRLQSVRRVAEAADGPVVQAVVEAVAADVVRRVGHRVAVVLDRAGERVGEALEEVVQVQLVLELVGNPAGGKFRLGILDSS